MTTKSRTELIFEKNIDSPLAVDEDREASEDKDFFLVRLCLEGPAVTLGVEVHVSVPVLNQLHFERGEFQECDEALPSSEYATPNNVLNPSWELFQNSSSTC